MFPVTRKCKKQSAEESSKQGKVTRLKAIYLLRLRRHCQRTQSELKQSRRKAAGKIPRGAGGGAACRLRPGGVQRCSGDLCLSPRCLACSLPRSRCGMRVCVCVCTSPSLSLSPLPVPLERRNANHFPLNLLLTLDRVIFNSCTGSVAPIVDISC